MFIGLALQLAGMLFGYANKRADNATEQIRIQTGLDIAEVQAKAQVVQSAQETIRKLYEGGTERQKAKMNSKVFWFLILAAEGPGLFNLAMVAIYNVFFWKNGIWPQAWAIAEFPAQSAVWVNLSIEWLFDPVGQLTTVSSAGLGGYLARRH